MSRSHYSLMAMVPLLTILSMSPAQVETQFSSSPSRGIASIIEEGQEVKELKHPKYEARAEKVDKSLLEKDAELDLTKFSEKADKYREQLLQERKDYKVDVIEADAVAAQKQRLEELVIGMVALEEDVKVLQEKKAWEPAGEEIAMNTMNEMKITLESLLQDEVENDLLVLQDKVKKEEEAAIAKTDEEITPPETTTDEVSPEEEKTDEVATDSEASKQEDLICELEEKNKALTAQVEALIADQKKVMETMMGLTQMMVGMYQRQQQQLPSYMTGPLVAPQHMYQYTTPTAGGNWVYYPDGFNPQQMTGQNMLGQNNYNQFQQSPNYQFPSQIPYQAPYMPYQEYDLRYSMPQPVMPGSFGDAPFQFNFGPGPSNIEPTPQLLQFA